MDYYGMNKVNPCAPPREVPSNNRCYYENQIPPTSPNRGRGSNVDENMHNNMQNYTESYFWRRFDSHINQVTPEGLKDLRMPLARVKRMMKSDDDVKKMMLSAEAPIVLSKGCEIFIGELALRCWFHTKCNKRKTLQKVDVVNAVCGTSTYDFLLDVISCDDINKPRSVRTPKDNPVFTNPMPMHTNL